MVLMRLRSSLLRVPKEAAAAIPSNTMNPVDETEALLERQDRKDSWSSSVWFKAAIGCLIVAWLICGTLVIRRLKKN